MNKKLLTLILALLFCFVTIKGYASSTTEPTRILKVGTNAEFAPFSYIEASEVKGFEIDLAKEVGKRLNCKIEIMDMPFDALVPELRSHSVDFIAAGMTITKERAKVVNFSKPYIAGEPLVACYYKENHSIHTLDELKNSKIIVNDSYTADFYVSDKLKLKPLRVSSPIDALMALKSKRGETYILAKNTLAPFKANGKNDSLDYFVLEDTSDNCAIMVAKGSDQLLNEINKVIDQLQEEGFVEKLKQKWGL